MELLPVMESIYDPILIAFMLAVVVGLTQIVKHTEYVPSRLIGVVPLLWAFPVAFIYAYDRPLNIIAGYALQLGVGAAGAFGIGNRLINGDEDTQQPSQAPPRDTVVEVWRE